MTIRELFNGATGLAKATVTPQSELSIARVSICNRCINSRTNKQGRCICPNCAPRGNHQDNCAQCCGCFYEAKAKLSEHHCPQHKW